MSYSIIPIFLGSVETDKGDSLYKYPRGEKLNTVYSCFVLKKEGEVILVDSGLPSQEDIVKNGKPYRRMENAPDFITALKNADVDPDRIETVILTHLHYDHSCNLRLLKNLKKVYVQQEEVLYALAPEQKDFYFYSLREDCGGAEWIDAIGKFVILDGDAEIKEGIRALLTPGHSKGSQSVVVDTADGEYILTGDFIAIRQSYEDKIPNAINYSEEVWFESLKKIEARVNAGAKILPSHDDSIFDKKIYG